MTEDEMAGWCHQCNEHKLGITEQLRFLSFTRLLGNIREDPAQGLVLGKHSKEALCERCAGPMMQSLAILCRVFEAPPTPWPSVEQLMWPFWYTLGPADSKG